MDEQPLNRATIVRGIVACEALAKRLRARLADEAATDAATNGTIPSWKIAGVNVVGSATHDSVVVTDEAAFLAWVAERHPTEVETIRRVRPAWLSGFLTDVVGRGNPPCDAEGQIVPGLEWRPGGEFKTLTYKVDPEVKALVAAHADEIATGRRPLALLPGVLPTDITALVADDTEAGESS